MTWWDRLKAIVRREAEDVKEGLESVGRSLDEALARKEREAAATPAERVEMILEDIEDEDRRFDEIVTRAGDPAPLESSRQVASRARVLSDEDAPDTETYRSARKSVSVEPVGDQDPMTGVFDFRVSIDLELPADTLSAIALSVESHALVLDVLERKPGSFWVATPALHADDVALLTAIAIADRLGSG